MTQDYHLIEELDYAPINRTPKGFLKDCVIKNCRRGGCNPSECPYCGWNPSEQERRKHDKLHKHWNGLWGY